MYAISFTTHVVDVVTSASVPPVARHVPRSLLPRFLPERHCKAFIIYHTKNFVEIISSTEYPIVTIEAVCDTKICYIPYLKVEEFFATNVETMQVKCTLIEQSYLLMYHRLIDMYCKTTAELYLDLLNRCPDIQEYITLKEIASFLQVTPETISRIRRGLNK